MNSLSFSFCKAAKDRLGEAARCIHLDGQCLLWAVHRVGQITVKAGPGKVDHLADQPTLHPDRANTRLQKHEQLGRIFVVADEWAVENEFLTPTMKIKRDLIEEKYETVVAMPADSKVVWL